jgi:glycosyltransferase involved in cell wall biosynthesis
VKHSDTPARSKSIEISVVVPVRNEEDSVRALLDGLLSQTLPPAEIVLTDTGSIDATREIIEEFISRGAPMKLVREPAGLPGRGRNLAVANSRCDWIAFTDAGNRHGPDWLAELAEKIDDDAAVDVVYGTYEPVVDSFFKECAAMAYVPPPVEIEGALVRPTSIVSALMRRSVWEAVGGFPEHLRSAEDLLFLSSVEQKGFRIRRAPRAVVYWSIQPNLWRTFKRFVTYARNNIRAGLWRQWQAAIFQRYAVLAVLALPAIFFGARWLVVPLAGGIFLLVGRALKALRANRRSYPAGVGRNVLRAFALVPIIATLDAAAFVGSLNWLLLDLFHLARTIHDDGSRE